MNHLKEIYPPVVIKDTEDVKITACITFIHLDILSNEIIIELLIDTITETTPQGLKSPDKLRVSNENKIPVYTNLQSPKYDVNGNPVYISEMQLWLNLSDEYTLKQCLELMQQSLKRKYGIITSPFVYIENN
ncbi:hypothetical protein V9L05_17965 [Bernardetia sp. Wsw4-3y2]|uniref:hypothetical protein n=1 Tax=Bernardetia sp. Wsw4-3y2 TaxID=3127471 RepID=UPI0030CBB80A